MNKKGQLAIFIIVALVIVTIFLVFLVYPKVNLFSSEEFTPIGYLKNCIEPQIKISSETISKHGGVLEPQGFIFYNNSKIQYLCYTSEYLKTCVVQQPMIREKFEDELEKIMTSKISTCVQNLRREYESKGYTVSATSPESKITIVPGNMRISIEAPMTITKENSQTFKQFNIDVESQLYDVLLTATNIIQFESALGDSETSLYIRYYPNLKIKKIDAGDGNKVYIVSDVRTKESFIFASRSLSWPPGYGLV